VRMTGDWYRDVLKGGRDALEVTTEQIVAYEASASERGRVWRRTEAAA